MTTRRFLWLVSLGLTLGIIISVWSQIFHLHGFQY